MPQNCAPVTSPHFCGADLLACLLTQHKMVLRRYWNRTHWRRVDSQTAHITANEWKASIHSKPEAACLCMRMCAFGREHNAASVSATRSVRDKSHLPVQYCQVQTECSHSPRAKSKTNKTCTSLLPVLTNTSGTTSFLYLAGCFNLSQSCFKVVNILVSQQAETSPKGVDREGNKAGIVPPCRLSVATMSYSVPLKRALIDSNFTF